MRLRLLCILISVLSNLTVYSFCFAQTDAANTIIEDRIDELWTTGKLHVGNANIASKHWLSGLYERNDFKLLWQTRAIKQTVN